MNSPIIRSTPATCGGRCDTVLPNTTSERPVRTVSSRAHATCTEVFAVTPCERPRSRIAADVAAASSTPTSPLSAVTVRSPPVTRVGLSIPASIRCQAAIAASSSCACSHCR
ncbi:Uncharacterised protein [Mycobacteroides abscessus subsp. abscessus]|nr:Uncharacterised protein [Mycobacteroides abscessus subsp. abscessus]